MPVWPERVRISHPDPRLPPGVIGYVGTSIPQPPSAPGPTQPTSPLLGPPAPSYTPPPSVPGPFISPPLTVGGQQQGYETAPWFIQQKLPAPVEVPVKYESFRYEYTRLADMLGRNRISQREANIMLSEHIDENASVNWIKRYGLFDDPTTEKIESLSWSALTKINPALYLTKTPSGWQPQYDFGKYYQETIKYGEEKVGVPLQKAKELSLVATQMFNPDYWIAVAKGKGALFEFLGKVEYEQQFKLKEGDLFGVWTGVQAPAYTNIILPFAAGAGLGFAFRGVSAASIGVKGLTGKILGGFAAKAPWAIGGVLSGLVGIDIGVSAAYEEKELLPSGTTISKIGRYGLQFGSAAAGVKFAMGFKPTRGFAKGEYGELFVQEHITSFRGKPIVPYGKRVGVVKTPSGFARVVSPSKVGLRFQTAESFLKSITTGKSIIPFEPVVKPSVVKPIVSISQITGAKKITFDVGLGKFSVEKIPTKTSFKPFDTKFKPPPSKPMSIENILRRDLFKVDLQKQMFSIPTQTKLADFFKGSFLVDKNIFVQLEKTPMLKGISPFKPKPEVADRPSGVKDIFKITAKEEAKFDLVDKKAFDAIRNWKTYTLRDVVKIPPKQIKLFEKPMRPMKPFKDSFVPPVKKVMTLEDIYGKMSKESRDLFFKRTRPFMKTTQTSLNKIFSFDVKDIILVVSKQPPSKPFSFKKPVVKPDVFKQPSGKAELIQIKKPSKTVVKDVGLAKESFDTKPSQSYDEFLNSYSRMGKGKTRIRLIEEETYYSKFWEGKSPVMFFKDKKTELFVEPMQKFRSELDSIQMEKLGFDTRTMLKERQLFETMQDVDVLQDQFQKQAQGQMFQQVSKTQLDLAAQQYYKFVSPTTTTTKPPPPVAPFPLLDGISQEIQQKLFPSSYIVQVKKRMYFGGVKKRGDVWYSIGKPMNRYDASRFGKSFIEHNAKASIKLVPSTKKPGRLPKRIPYFDDSPFSYTERGDIIVENPINRINTRGEILGISKLGWSAPRKKRKMNRRRGLL